MAVKKAAKVKAGTSVKKIAAPKATASTKSSVSSKLTSAASAAKQFVPVPGGTTAAQARTGRRRGRRGALWYQREILRLKLKKRYERVKYGGGR